MIIRLKKKRQGDKVKTERKNEQVVMSDKDTKTKV